MIDMHSITADYTGLLFLPAHEIKCTIHANREIESVSGHDASCCPSTPSWDIGKHGMKNGKGKKKCRDETRREQETGKKMSKV